tara:strand:+ start:414 stop:605 length:192 start_codon:yes stop_codon:yes gene_type:complete
LLVIVTRKSQQGEDKMLSKEGFNNLMEDSFHFLTPTFITDMYYYLGDDETREDFLDFMGVERQ